ncbi:hypothetical protein VTO42DRAFT_1988 [Malbranchea cinnamomea]
MQFALPPRKSSHLSRYAGSSSTPALRRQQLKLYATLAGAVLFLILLLSRIFSSSSPKGLDDTFVPNGPKVVLVTVLDEQKFSDKYIQRIKQNREDYAARHGYANFFASIDEYTKYIGEYPQSWATIPAMRHAMTLYPGSTYFFHLSPHALIMEPTVPLTSHVLDRKRLESLMLKDVPVVPPNSVIKTFSHLTADDIDLIITQDGENLCPGSFVIKRGDWAKYFLDVWFDPLYRSYKFAKAEIHALDHIIQWHPTLLAKLALIPQRTINAYSPTFLHPGPNGVYQEGDFIIRFAGCETDKGRDCEKEMEPYWIKWAKKTNNEE